MVDFSILNEGQLDIVNKAYDWYFNTNEPLFQYEGPPGTGKSLYARYLAKEYLEKKKISNILWICVLKFH